MGRADGAGAFNLGISEMDGCRPQAVHKLVFTSDALTERLSRFHFSTIDVVPLRSVQKTGQLKPVLIDRARRRGVYQRLGPDRSRRIWVKRRSALRTRPQLQNLTSEQRSAVGGLSVYCE